MKTSELIGSALDWAVALANNTPICPSDVFVDLHLIGKFNYSTDWAQGGPIIERESITLRTNACVANSWVGFIDFGGSNCNVKARQKGPTPLSAAMRCYVASKLGDEVEIPEVLVCG